MGFLAVQGRLQRVASVRHDGVAELCAAAGRADELQPGSRQRPARSRRDESRTNSRATGELKTGKRRLTLIYFLLTYFANEPRLLRFPFCGLRQSFANFLKCNRIAVQPHLAYWNLDRGRYAPDHFAGSGFF